MRVGDNEKALQCLGQANELFEALGNRELEARGLERLAYVHNALGNRQRELSCYERGLVIFQALLGTG